MTNEICNDRIIYLYCITCNINNKFYIGQTVDPDSRWRGHRRDAAEPKVPFHFAIKKHGAHNFNFEIIASCKGQDNANELETILVKQYDSYVANGKGYNATHGGFNAPKTEAWIQAMKDWHASLSLEEKEARSQMHREAMFRLIAEKGHPAQGRIVTEEEKELHRKARLENPLEYTDELRQKMSEAHIGIKDTEETKQKKTESAIEAWAERIDFSRKCSVPGCEIEGKAKYKIINGIRYCNKHGLRVLRNDTTEKLPPFKYSEDNPMPEEVRKKCGLVNLGKVAHNRIVFTEEQTFDIINNNLSIKKTAKIYDVTEKVIKRIRDGKF